MATVKQVREWLDLLPDEAEIVVWHAEMAEREIISVIHMDDSGQGEWDRAIVVAGEAHMRVQPALRVVK